MNRLEIRGVIVPSVYDSEWSQDYIEKGLIIPESAFRRNLAAMPKDKPLSVYINSPGGSVFSVYEMINAVREWKKAGKQPVDIVIGAMAASAASMFAVSVAGKVRAHQNAKMMFHGASAWVEGGKEAMQDEAALLGKINAEVQQVLIQRFKLDPDTVADWFREGRQGWLTAEEMLAAGIVSEIIADDDAAVDFDDDAINHIHAERGLDIAAVLETGEAETEDEGGDNADGESEGDGEGGDTESEGDGTDSEGAGTDGEGAGEGEDGGDGEGSGEPSEEYQRGHADAMAAVEARMTAEYGENVEKLKAALKSAEDRASLFQSEKDKAVAATRKAEADADKRCADLRAQLEEATEKLRKFVSGALTFSPAIETWEDAMAACGQDYPKAKEKYPELCAKYRAEQNSKR